MNTPETLPAPVWVPTGELIPNPGNPRYIKDAKFKRLVKSIREAPWMLKLRPIVATRDNIVLGGNMRLQASKAAGVESVPVVYAENLSPTQIQEFVIKDNVGYGEWDWEVLANEWDVEVLKDWDLEIPNITGPPAIDKPAAPETAQYFGICISYQTDGPDAYPEWVAPFDNKQDAIDALHAHANAKTGPGWTGFVFHAPTSHTVYQLTPTTLPDPPKRKPTKK